MVISLCEIEALVDPDSSQTMIRLCDLVEYREKLVSSWCAFGCLIGRVLDVWIDGLACWSVAFIVFVVYK